MKKGMMAALLFTTMLAALFIGRYGSSIEEVLQALMQQGDMLTQRLIWNIRMPRMLLVVMSGGALAVSGYIFQTIFKNPLASGDVIGAASGCSLGAAIAILTAGGMFALQLYSFLGGMLAVVLTMLLAHRIKGNRVLNLVVIGIVVQAIMSAALMLLKISADPNQELASIEYWLMGGFSNATWTSVGIAFILIAVSLALLYLFRWQIQMLTFGEEARTMGISTRMITVIALLLATLLVSSVISFAGVVSWVGLLIPHIVRQIHKQMVSKSLGFTFLCGAWFLLVCDILSRSLFVIELPISILTSLFGAVCLLVLFVKGRLRL